MITTIIDDQKLTVSGDWGFLAGFLGPAAVGSAGPVSRSSGLSGMTTAAADRSGHFSVRVQQLLTLEVAFRGLSKSC